MRFTIGILLSVSLVATLAQAQIHHFDHIIVVVQENRTPDNLFRRKHGHYSFNLGHSARFRCSGCATDVLHQPRSLTRRIQY